MSITSGIRANGHHSKRRKLSHDSNADADMHEAAVQALKDNTDHVASTSSGDQDGDSEVRKVETTRKSIKARSHPKRLTGTSMTPSVALQYHVQHLVSAMKPIDNVTTKEARRLTDKLTGMINAIPAQKAMSYAQAQSFAQKNLRVTIPWSQRPTADIQYTFEYAPPSKITIERSAIRRDGSKVFCQMLVPQMPATMFQDKDYLNHRAIHKRAFYLACLASAIQREASRDVAVHFAFLDDNELVPIIKVTQKATDRSIVCHICPSFPASLGPVEKLIPSQNCVRKRDLAQRHGDDNSNASPVYNSTIRELASFTTFSELIASATLKADHFTDACYLGEVWLEQRGFSESATHGGFGLWQWTILCALLLESGGHQGRPLFSPRYSAIQLFKAVLQVLVGRDMYDPFVVRGEIEVVKTDHPIMFDCISGVNILYRMSSSAYARLNHYAKIALAALNSKKDNGFDPTFDTRVSQPGLEFDEVYSIDLKGLNLTTSTVSTRLYDLLKQGLGDRVSAISIQSAPISDWKVTSSAPSVMVSRLHVGFQVNADAATRLVDHGPLAEEKIATKEFRNFWGEKAELRRFRDGRISESLVWSTDTPVTGQIVEYLVSKHFGLTPNSIRACLVLDHMKLPSIIPADEAFSAVNTKFQALSSTLHHLEGLPLPIRSVSAASELNRSASLKLPLEPGVVQPVDVVVQFDSSGRWPDDLRAIQYTKIAFLTKIGDLLTQNDRTFECHIGLENTSTSNSGTSNTSYLDIINPSPSAQLPPIIFRLRIYHDREVHLVQQALSSKTLLNPLQRDIHLSALQTQKQSLTNIAHTSAIRSFITAFPPLSTTIRLLKRFLASHHLTPHFPPEVIEAIACHTFLNPAPWSIPGTPTTAFARCLHFLSRWDWSSTPLIVDLSLGQDMTVEQRSDLETRFAAWRKIDPNMNSVVWFVGTNLDGTGVVWTQGSARQDPKPPRVVAGRLTALATAALQVIESVENRDIQILTKADWDAIFASSVEHFDFTLHLKKSVVHAGKPKGGIEGKYKNLQLASALEVDISGVDTLESYLEDLVHSFGSVAVFFYGGKHSGSELICGLWRPHIRPGAAREFKIRLGMSTKPEGTEVGIVGDADEPSCIANIDGMLAEMASIGEGIVDKITSRYES